MYKQTNKIVYHEVHVPKSLISKIFEPFLKSCTSEVRVPWGRVPRGLTVLSRQTSSVLLYISIYCTRCILSHLFCLFPLVFLYFCLVSVWNSWEYWRRLCLLLCNEITIIVELLAQNKYMYSTYILHKSNYSSFLSVDKLINF